MSLEEILARTAARMEAGENQNYPEHEGKISYQISDTVFSLPQIPCRHFTDAPVSRGGCGTCQAKWVYPCEIYGTCSPEGYHVGVKRCSGCVHRAGANSEIEEPRVKRLLLVNSCCPGDVLVMSAAVESLHRAHPGKYLTAFEGTAPELFDHNPHIVHAHAEVDGKAVTWDRIEMNYPLVDQCDARPVHFLQGYCEYLETVLKVPVPLAVNRPYLYLTPEEIGWTPQVYEGRKDRPRYWLVNAGYKDDYPAKWWGASNYQRVVDLLKDRVTFVQIGETGHTHPPLSGVIDMRGKTDIRQLVRMTFHAAGGLGPSTFLQHLCAAFDKPYVCLAGGREPLAWQHYSRQATLSTIGKTACSTSRAGVSCWKDLAVPDPGRPGASVCELPVITTAGEPIPTCLNSITPERVAEEIIARYTVGTSFH